MRSVRTVDDKKAAGASKGPGGGKPEGGRHPLASMILGSAAGTFPSADGGWRRLAPWRPGLEALVAFTAHAVVCVDDDIEDELLRRLGIDGLGGAHAPRVLTALAGPDGWISSLDVVMVRLGGPSSPVARTSPERDPQLVERPDLAVEPRVAYAARLREDLTVFGYPDARRRAVAIVGRGIGGLRELSYELEPGRRGRGEGAAFVRAAVRAVGASAVLAACVAPGNVASLRVLLGCGFVPVGSVQLVRRPPGYRPSLGE